MRCPPEEHLVIGNDAYGKRNVHTEIDDPTFDIVDLYMTQKLDELAVLSTDVEVYDKIIDIETTGVTPVPGNFVCLQEGIHYYQGEILAVTPITGNQYTITLDSPLDFAFTVAGGCSLTDPNMNVNGSIVPVTFFISPGLLNQDVRWHCTRIMLHITDDAAMDDSRFGGIPALTNGIVLRVNNGYVKNIFNAKSNGDFAQRTFDVTYSSKAPAGEYGVTTRRTFSGQDKNGVVVTVSAATFDKFEMLIQDDLSGLLSMKCIVQGHYDQHEN